MKIGLRTGVGLLCAAAFLSGYAPAFAQDAGLQQQFKEAVDLLNRGQDEPALQKLKAILAANPSQEDAYQLVSSTSSISFLKMLEKRGEYAQIANRILSLAQREEVMKSKDGDAIRALAARATGSNDVMETTLAAEELSSKHGEFAVPALVGYLGSNDVNTRANAIIALRKIGSDGVTALAASLGSGSDLQQRNVAAILGMIGDARAVPALLRAAKGSGTAAAEAAKAAASLGAKGTDPAEAYIGLAMKYLAGDGAAVRDYDRATTVWSVKDGNLVGTDVPKFLYPMESAEQAAYDALSVSPGNSTAAAVIALVQFVEQAAYDNLPDSVKATPAAQEAAKSLAGLGALGASVGADSLNTAYALASKLKNGDAAHKVADAIVSVAAGRAVGADNALVQGLSHEDRSIRYASAIALLRLAPAGAFPGADKVAAIAGQAAAERATKAILVVDSDGKNAATIQRALNDAGFHAVSYGTGTEALAAAKATAGFDAILVRSRLSDIAPMSVLDEINRDFRTSGMKKVVMAEGADLQTATADYEKRGISGVSPTSVDLAGVVNAVKKAVESAEGDAGRIKANALAKRACAALGGSTSAAIPLKDAVAGLLDAAGEGADEDVRVAALGALANCAGADAQSALRGIVGKKENSVAVRTAAAGALGRAIRGATPANETVAALIAAMGEDDLGLRSAAGAALGSAKLSPAQAADVLNTRR